MRDEPHPTAEDSYEIVAAEIYAWVDNLPEPNKDIAEMPQLDGSSIKISARQIAQHVAERTEFGKQYVQSWKSLSEE